MKNIKILIERRKNSLRKTTFKNDKNVNSMNFCNVCFVSNKKNKSVKKNFLN